MNIFSVEKSPKQVAKEIALKFKNLRGEAKISRKELAARSGVSESSIKRFETTGQISLVALLKISQILKRLDEFDPIFEKKSIHNINDLFSDKMKAE